MNVEPKAVSRCDGKERFITMEMARRVAKRRRRRLENGPGGAYRCPDCKGFHIGQIFNRRYRTKQHRRREIEDVEA